MADLPIGAEQFPCPGPLPYEVAPETFEALLLPYAFVAGLVVYSLARLLERLKTPPVVVAIVAALLAAFVSGYIVLGIGWYIAVSEAPVYFAMVLGAIYGGFSLPRRRTVKEGR